MADALIVDGDGQDGSVTWERFLPDWTTADVDVDVDAAQAWAACGGQWLTDPDVAVPTTLVTMVAGVTSWLDGFGAGLHDLFGNHGLGALIERAATQSLPRSGRVSSGGACRLIRCADGWLAVSLARTEDFASLPAWLGIDPVDDVWSAVEVALESTAIADAIERSTLLGIACAAVGERVTRGTGIAIDSLGAAAPSRMDELVIVNLASLWAGPLAADVLARCGARVITIESTTRPDGARAWPAFFDDLHGQCESVALDFTDSADRRRLADLLRCADVVIEGSRPRALEQLGIDARAMTATGPRIWASITGHGRVEPHAHRIGFGDDAAAAGGLIGWVGDEPRFIADAIADPITGLWTAAAIAQLATGDGRWLVDVPLAAVAAAHVGSASDAPRHDSLPPRPRRVRGQPIELGRDTERVLTEFGIANS